MHGPSLTTTHMPHDNKFTLKVHDSRRSPELLLSGLAHWEPVGVAAGLGRLTIELAETATFAIHATFQIPHRPHMFEEEFVLTSFVDRRNGLDYKVTAAGLSGSQQAERHTDKVINYDNDAMANMQQ